MRVAQYSTAPCATALHQHGDIWIVDDSDEVDPKAIVLTGNTARDAIPIRNDLPEGGNVWPRTARPARRIST